MKLQIKPAEEEGSGELQLVDFYGNPVTEVKQELTYSIPTSAFSGKTAFFDGETEIASEVKDEHYVFSTKAVKISYKAGSAEESAETTAEESSAATQEKTENQAESSKKVPNSVLLIGAAAFIIAAVQMRRKKSQ